VASLEAIPRSLQKQKDPPVPVHLEPREKRASQILHSRFSPLAEPKGHRKPRTCTSNVHTSIGMSEPTLMWYWQNQPGGGVGAPHYVRLFPVDDWRKPQNDLPSAHALATGRNSCKFWKNTQVRFRELPVHVAVFKKRDVGRCQAPSTSNVASGSTSSGCSYCRQIPFGTRSLFLYCCFGRSTDSSSLHSFLKLHVVFSPTLTFRTFGTVPALHSFQRFRRQHFCSSHISERKQQIASLLSNNIQTSTVSRASRPLFYRHR